MPEIKRYDPWVCPNKDCYGYGDTVPSDYGRCFICFKPLVHYSQVPYEDVISFVRRVLEHQHKMYGERELRGDMVEQTGP